MCRVTKYRTWYRCCGEEQTCMFHVRGRCCSFGPFSGAAVGVIVIFGVVSCGIRLKCSYCWRVSSLLDGIDRLYDEDLSLLLLNCKQLDPCGELASPTSPNQSHIMHVRICSCRRIVREIASNPTSAINAHRSQRADAHIKHNHEPYERTKEKYTHKIDIRQIRRVSKINVFRSNAVRGPRCGIVVFRLSIGSRTIRSFRFNLFSFVFAHIKLKSEEHTRANRIRECGAPARAFLPFSFFPFFFFLLWFAKKGMP